MANPNMEENKDMFALLSKKIDDHARLLRMLVVICSLAILACMFYSLTSIVDILPDLVIARLMGKLDTVQREWQVLEKLSTGKNRK